MTTANAKNKGTQIVRILNYMKSGKELTTSEARSKLRVARLSARIFELREMGFTVFTNRKTATAGPERGQRVTTYTLGSL
jgi:hypothetical protein